MPRAERTQFKHPSASHAKKKRAPPFIIEPISAFYVFLVANLAAAVLAPIQDCDETFNYWEPTHYLSHGYGLQTWEYSPAFGIRSWLYVLLHAIVGNIRRILPHSSKPSEFYFVRYVLATSCALCQTLMWRAICIAINARVGLFFIMALALSPGNFHASTAYLPSSFSMYMVMLGTAAFMNWRGGLKTSWGMFWYSVGVIVGWPFSGALCVPFLLEEAVLCMFSAKEHFLEAFVRFIRGVVAAMLVAFADLCVNTLFYRKFVLASWNIVKYNVFSASARPSLYGTEPWPFYFKNLALNFHLWFVLALLSGPLFVLHRLPSHSSYGFQSGLRTVVFLVPFYLWLAIFTLQPHKEERFMYPAYPFLALNAAFSTHTFLHISGSPDPSSVLARFVPARIRLLGLTSVLLLSLITGLVRIWGLYTAFSAPLRLYDTLWAPNATAEMGLARSDGVCFGKEWYRFPTSYFLPGHMHARFVRSEFRGLLPGDFHEGKTGFGLRSGTWLLPPGLNDRNEEDPSKYVDVRSGACKFLVDSQFDHAKEDGWAPPPNEPDYVADEKNWEVVRCERFLDAARTAFLGRVLWVPDWEIVPARFRRQWGRMCLLRKRR